MQLVQIMEIALLHMTILYVFLNKIAYHYASLTQRKECMYVPGYIEIAVNELQPEVINL
jgi:hypothetical protein